MNIHEFGERVKLKERFENSLLGKYNTKLLNTQSKKAPTKKIRDATFEECKEIEPVVKDAAKAVRNKPETKKYIKQSVQQIRDEYSDYAGCSDIEIIKPECYIQKDGKSGYFVLWDGEQECRILMCDVSDDIIEYIKSKHPEINGKYVLNTGDGDEGCIYVKKRL